MKYNLLIDEHVVNHHKLAIDIDNEDPEYLQAISDKLGECKTLEEIKTLIRESNIEYNNYKEYPKQETEELNAWIL